MKKILLILFVSCLFSQEITVNDTIAIQNKMLKKAKLELEKRFIDLETEKKHIEYTWKVINSMIVEEVKSDNTVIK